MLPLRKPLELTYTYHRPPTPYELKFGWGYTHYADIPLSVCAKYYQDDAGEWQATLKKWCVNPTDGLRYYR